MVLEVNWRAGKSLTEIAAVLGVAVSTVSREVARNNSAQHGFKNPLLRILPKGRARAPYRVGYRGEWAQRRADMASRRPKQAKLVGKSPLRREVLEKLCLRWSPHQIVSWLVETYPDRPEMWVSHETIYQAIYVQSRGICVRS